MKKKQSNFIAMDKHLRTIKNNDKIYQEARQRLKEEINSLQNSVNRLQKENESWQESYIQSKRDSARNLAVANNEIANLHSVISALGNNLSFGLAAHEDLVRRNGNLQQDLDKNNSKVNCLGVIHQENSGDKSDKG